MEKKSITMKPLFQEQDVVFYEEGNGFSNWELINESDAEDSDSDSLHSLENGFVYWSSSRSRKTSQEIVAQDTQQDQDVVFHVNSHLHEDYDDDDDNCCVYRMMPVLFPAARVQYEDGIEDVDDEEEDDDDDDGYGLNGELVPWNVSGKLGRQRMRKLGKRIFPKMSSSKRSPFLHVKPGCVNGKHGLGLKA
ncbi:VID27-LIKE PROTEIN [Salix viminalis]|uniref:VID27-LIKE PROTEIN n=1 Tax=Salix viminalis TaxID=40686 RepID=A0A9Q0NKC9_SALVM|nr:VID27-LIKE PROTEIN [Salix viminalis]